MPITNFADLIDGIKRGYINPSNLNAVVGSSPTPKPITWDEAKKRKYEYGVSKGVLFLMKDGGTYEPGVPWTGLTAIKDASDGAELKKIYADNALYGGIRGAEAYHATIDALGYPDEFLECDGYVEVVPGMYIGQQPRRRFGLCWRSEIGNADKHSEGYKIHVAYGLAASPTERSHKSATDSPEATTHSWNADSNPAPVNGHKPTTKLEFDSTKVSPARMAVAEDLLYNGAKCGLPAPNDILNMLEYAYGPDAIGRQQITGEIDYVKDGVLYRGANAPTILINEESELDALAPICNPGAFAFNQDMSRMWQLDANETWVRMI